MENLHPALPFSFKHCAPFLLYIQMYYIFIFHVHRHYSCTCMYTRHCLLMLETIRMAVLVPLADARKFLLANWRKLKPKCVYMIIRTRPLKERGIIQGRGGRKVTSVLSFPACGESADPPPVHRQRRPRSRGHPRWPSGLTSMVIFLMEILVVA